jgi:23S rRNA (cytidine1920-2'-O)/16S rRNA (cytidine1409-2'-O)-methyltransferase
MATEEESRYVSRAGLKIEAALAQFGLDVTGMVCADLGANIGGFADCLLKSGAAHVYTVETGYGILAWKLRQDKRVTMFERTNALYFDPWPPGIKGMEGVVFSGCDLVVIDLGWTRQKLAIPAALKWLRKERSQEKPGRILSLIKPHYEADSQTLSRGKKAILQEADSEAICARVLEEMPGYGVKVVGHMISPLKGSKGRGTNVGNVEYLALLEVEK